MLSPPLGQSSQRRCGFLAEGIKAFRAVAVREQDSVCWGKSILGEVVATSLPFSTLVLISLTVQLACRFLLGKLWRNGRKEMTE